MNQIKRIYISGPVSKGVAESQMLNWSHLLENEGIITSFLIFYNGSNINKLKTMNISEMKATVLCKKYINNIFLREITVFFFLWSFLHSISRSSKLVIQTRSSSFATPIFLLRLFFKFKIVYEIRGAGEEGGEKNRLRDLLNHFNDWLMLKMSHDILVVSNKLLQHKTRKYKVNNIINKSTIIYGAADEKYFYFDAKLRYKKRNELSIHDRLVILYVGMLDKYWQIPDTVFRIVSDLMNINSKFFFLVITPNIEIANGYRIKFNIDENNILIKESSQTYLNEFINASDYGLLLREDNIVNNVAAPTKFAEYLLGGLPVIISENVGDYSEFTVKHNVGIVLKMSRLSIETFAEKIIYKTFSQRNTIAEIGKKNFSKQKYLSALKSIYMN